MPELIAEIREFYVEAFRSLDNERDPPAVNIRFYPYIGINHTIRVRDGLVFVRIAEISREMPLAGHRALAYILVAKLLGKRIPKNARAIYLGHIRSDHIREQASASKRARGRKVLSGSAGSIYDLDEVFNDLNIKYFDGRLAKPVLSWSARKTYRILGHHDSTHETVVVSKSLDTTETPRFVVEYVMFHEMLHIFHPTVHHNGRRYNHTAAFRRDERRFPQFLEAEKWIERNARRLKRIASRR